MKKLFAILTIFVSFYTSAQNRYSHHHRKVPKGSIAYYEQQLSDLRGDAMLAVQATEPYKNLMDTLKLLRAASDNYRSLSLFYQGVQCDYATFNKSIAADGFTPFSSYRSRIGIGMSRKKNRRIFDLHFFVIGIADKSYSETASIKTNFSSMLDLSWGYDLLKSSNFSLYPYLGVGFRSSSIKYSAPVETDNSYTNLTNIIIQNKSVEAYKTVPCYLAGIGFDAHIERSQDRMSGTILFLKIGTNNTFRKESFKIHDTNYAPGYRQGDVCVSLGLKLYGGSL